MTSDFAVLTALVVALGLMVFITVSGGVTHLADGIFPADAFEAKWITNQYFRGE